MWGVPGRHRSAPRGFCAGPMAILPRIHAELAAEGLRMSQRWQEIWAVCPILWTELVGRGPDRLWVAKITYLAHWGVYLSDRGAGRDQQTWGGMGDDPGTCGPNGARCAEHSALAAPIQAVITHSDQRMLGVGAFAPRRSANSSLATGLAPRLRCEWRCSSSSKAGTTLIVGTPPSGTY